MVSTFFPLYITKYVDVKIYSFLYALSLLLSFFLALVFGWTADRKALRKPFFTLFSFLTVLFTLLLFPSYGTPLLSLFFFYCLLIFHQQSMVFYNSLLLDFSSRGLASGVGVAFGYMGSALALTLLAEHLKEPELYLLVGVLVLLLSLPSWIVLENPSQRGEFSLGEVLRDRVFLLFLVSLLTLTEVANTLVAMMGVYLREVFSLGNLQIYRVIGLSALGGILGGLFWGKLTDLFGVRRVFLVGFLLWPSFLLLLFLASEEVLLLVGLFGGFCLSHLWTTSRVFVVNEFPKESVSVRMSFLSLTERMASTVGLGLWGLFLLLTGDDYRLSALLMGLLPLIGLFFYLLSRQATE